MEDNLHISPVLECDHSALLPVLGLLDPLDRDTFLLQASAWCRYQVGMSASVTLWGLVTSQV